MSQKEVKKEPKDEENNETDEAFEQMKRGVYEENVNVEGKNNIRNDNEDNEINEDDPWVVINAYFNEHHLVSQQIGSFNQFVETEIQKIINENHLCSTISDSNFSSSPINKRYEIDFGTVHIDKNPVFNEHVGKERRVIHPNEARVRNLTYESDLSLDFEYNAYNIDAEKEDEELIENKKSIAPVNIGKIPIMVKSKFCSLYGKSQDELIEVKECIYDQGGYFIINGGEKVIVAQERMATNFVYVFCKKEQNKSTWQAEIRSSVDGSNRPPAQFSVKLCTKDKDKSTQTIKASIPYINQDIPIVILFRALGVISDENIINHILFNPNDNSMTELFRPSL